MPIDLRYAGRALAASSEVTATLPPRAPGTRRGRAPGVAGRLTFQPLRDRLEAGHRRHGRGLARPVQGRPRVREADRAEDDAAAAGRPRGPGRDVHQRGHHRLGLQPPERRARVRLRAAGGAPLHRDGVRPRRDVALRAQADAGARRAAADRGGAARDDRRLRGAARGSRARRRATGRWASFTATSAPTTSSCRPAAPPS